MMYRAHIPVAFAAAAALFWSSFALSGPVTAQAGNVVDPLHSAIGHEQELKSLQRAMLDQQQADGGQLTPEHRAKFQRRLDRMNIFYRNKLTNNNPLTVDASGHPVNPRSVTGDWTMSKLILVGSPS